MSETQSTFFDEGPPPRMFGQLDANDGDTNGKMRDGFHCHACGQKVKIYRRILNASFALWLIALHRLTRRVESDDGFYGVVEITEEIRAMGHIDRHHDFAKLKHWGLIVEEEKIGADGIARTSGRWRTTPRGVSFASGASVAPKYVNIYNAESLGLDGDPITIRDALGNHFSFDELMKE